MALTAWQTILELIAVFCLSALAGYLFTRAKGYRHQLSPVLGAKVRIRGRRQIYHCRLEAVQPTRWTFSPPVARDSYYPMARGEEIIAETSVGSGRLLFRTSLICADRFRGRVWVEPPKKTFYVEAKAAREMDLRIARNLALK